MAAIPSPGLGFCRACGKVHPFRKLGFGGGSPRLTTRSPREKACWPEFLMMRLTLSLSDNPATTSVERAIMEFRSARPVVIDGTEGSALVVGVENLDEAMALEIEAVAGGHAHLLLPAARLRRLGLEREVPGRVALPVVERDRVETLALKVDGRIDAPVR